MDILNLTGAVRLIQDYKMPLTLANECAGIVEKVGKHVTRFYPGEQIYCRLLPHREQLCIS
ncbi:MAG: alcohol dehydrogenase catalytic domain-containing protein [Faecousia sp.]